MSELTPNPRVGSRVIGGKTVAFNCQNHLIAVWNSAGGSVWDGLLESENIEDLAQKLAPEWGVNITEAKSGISEFICELQKDGFVLGGEDFPIQELPENDGSGEAALLTVEMMAIESLVPYAVTFETTYACNEHCIHCFMERDKPSLELIQITNILNQLEDAGTLFLSLTGGEFFCRKDALEIIEFVHHNSFVVDILSNGTLINGEIASYLSRRNVRRVQISLYGSSAKTHDSITRVVGSFKGTLKGIENLRSAGVKVEIAFPMMNRNFSERYQVWDLAKRLGCLLSPSPIITARNDGSADTYDLRLTDEQFRDFLMDRDFSGLYSGRKPFADHQLYLHFSDILDAAPCYGGFNTCAINPDGLVYPCNQLLYGTGDLTKNSFREIWNGPELEKLRQLTIRNLPECSQCDLLRSCSRCPGLAFLEGKDLLGCSPENCRQARMYKEYEEVTL